MVTYEEAIAYFKEQKRIYESLLKNGHALNQTSPTKRIMYLDIAIEALEKMKNVRETGRLL